MSRATQHHLTGHPRSDSSALPRSGWWDGAALAWFLLFPSLGVVQKYLGTGGALSYLAIGAVALTGVGIRGAARVDVAIVNRRGTSVALAVLFALLAIGFVVVYPWSSTHVGFGGSDRDESLNVGVRELLAGRYPYYQQTPLQNAVTQLPGGLLLSVPFALMGNAAWQNLFWFAAFFVLVHDLFDDKFAALAFLALVLIACPVLLQDFVTGGDLGASVIAMLVGMLLMIKLVPDPSAAKWKTVGVAVLTGVTLSSRLHYVLLLPPLFATLGRRAGVAKALSYVGVTGFAFAAVTLPFYWYDAAGFAPLYVHNKFSQFGEVPHAGIVFPAVSVLLSLLIAIHPGNRSLRGWLIQSGLIMSIPVVFLVALASLRSHRVNFVFTDYALVGALFGGLGAGLTVFQQDPVWTPGKAST